MPTVAVQVTDKRVLLRVSVAVPSERSHVESHNFEALVDTGAQCTMVSRRVIDQIGATQVGFLPFMPASGQPQETAVYELFVAVVISETGPDGSPTFTFSKGGTVPVLLLPFEPPDFDMLLGMDILTGYHVTMWDGTFVLSI